MNACHCSEFDLVGNGHPDIVTQELKRPSRAKGVKMSSQAQRVLSDARKLPPVERAELVERILASFSLPERQSTDERWAAEVEDRIDAYERGDLKSRPATEVFAHIG
jgi:putative addiction module component (TIGR02574 family)